MFLRLSLAFLVSSAFILPQDAMAATTKKTTSSSSAKNQTKKRTTAARNSSSDKYRKIGDGPLGALVAGPDQQVFLNIAGFLYGMPTLGYEHAIGADNSWTVQLGYRSWGITDVSINYLGLVGSYRWYLGDHAKLQGFYAGPLGTAQMVNVSYKTTTLNGFNLVKKDESANSFIFGVGGEGGYQWMLPFGMTFSAGLNAIYSFGSITVASGAPSFNISGFGAGLNGTVGYAF